MTLEERLNKFLTETPQVDKTAYIANSAELIGAVTIGANASVWPKCVLRGDIERIIIGEGSNVQDGTIIHLADDLPVIIGKNVTIGHAAMIHACTIEDECLIGMKATILDGAIIGKGSVVGAGAVVTKGTIVPPNSMVLGIPGKIVKTLPPSDNNLKWALKYQKVALAHRQNEAGVNPMYLN